MGVVWWDDGAVWAADGGSLSRGRVQTTISQRNEFKICTNLCIHHHRIMDLNTHFFLLAKHLSRSYSISQTPCIGTLHSPNPPPPSPAQHHPPLPPPSYPNPTSLSLHATFFPTSPNPQPLTHPHQSPSLPHQSIHQILYLIQRKSRVLS